jgi:hypothetical protein
MRKASLITAPTTDVQARTLAALLGATVHHAATWLACEAAASAADATAGPASTAAGASSAPRTRLLLAPAPGEQEHFLCALGRGWVPTAPGWLEHCWVGGRVVDPSAFRLPNGTSALTRQPFVAPLLAARAEGVPSVLSGTLWLRGSFSLFLGGNQLVRAYTCSSHTKV